MTNFSSIELNSINALLNSLNEIGKFEMTEKTEAFIIEALTDLMPLTTHLVAHYNFKKIERITINRNILKTNKRIRNIDFLKYPPKEYVKSYGRCNLKNQSVFYGATLITTALSEMRPKVGDLITKSIWRNKTGHTFKICPIFLQQPTNNTFNPRTFELTQDFHNIIDKQYSGNMKEAVLNVSKFIAYQFGKIVNSKNHLNYIFSAFFSDKILNEFDNGSIEGILYPSVKEKLSFENIALKPDVFDKNFILDEVRETIVIKDPSDGGGGLMQLGISNSKDFDFDKKEILWSDTINQPKERMDFYKEAFELDLT
ncbi:RES domain-containing protein [Flavobacteriaceae bacterium MAR_2009_75]|nr:RES domain-containing protein [Flavobacteriaceae bacterium MAR_2009_75]